jgi:glutamate-5-semialdehyde dehydrogenase
MGNCHVYLDAFADYEKALPIVHNAKVQRPSVCNAAETLLVHSRVAEAFFTGIIADLQAAGVEIRGMCADMQYRTRFDRSYRG